MAKSSSRRRDAADGRFVESNIAARERVVPRSSAAYVLAGGKGEAAYKLSKIIEGTDARYSRRSPNSGFVSKKG